MKVYTSFSSHPNVWTEQESLRNAQAFGLLTSYKEKLVLIGGRDPFSGVSLPLETKELGRPWGPWGIWASLSAEIAQYLSGCKIINQERICNNWQIPHSSPSSIKPIDQNCKFLGKTPPGWSQGSEELGFRKFSTNRNRQLPWRKSWVKHWLCISQNETKQWSRSVLFLWWLDQVSSLTD